MRVNPSTLLSRALATAHPLVRHPHLVRRGLPIAIGATAVAVAVSVVPAAAAGTTDPSPSPSPSDSASVDPSASPSASAGPDVTSMTATAPTSVPAGSSTTVRAQLTTHGAPVADRQVQFQRRAIGASAWTATNTARTDANGWAALPVSGVTVGTEFAAVYSGVDGVGASSASRLVHVVDIRPIAPSRIRYLARTRVSAKLTKDGRAVANRRIAFYFRTSSTAHWSKAYLAWTRSDGWANLPATFRRTTQVGFRFRGGWGLSSSPLRTLWVHTYRPAPTFVFPFLHPTQAQPVSDWSPDQGVDIAARGYACGSNAILVAVGNGVVIQKGISGFGPTAPVIRMTSGPFAGRNVYYGHTGYVYVHVGDHVRIGQRIAQIGCGSVGYSSAPHLEIGVGVPGGPPCCPGFHQTSGEMWKQLTAALRRQLG